MTLSQEELYAVFRREYSVMAEYEALLGEDLGGVYAIPSFRSPLLWFGVVFVRGGHYGGGVFRFTLTLPETFPDLSPGERPTVTFQSRVFHPAVDPRTGELRLGRAFPRWNASENRIRQLLGYVRWIFHNVDVGDPADEEASGLYASDGALFAERAGECAASSADRLYDEPATDDRHYIRFGPYEPAVHDPVRASMLDAAAARPPPARGLSWVAPGALRPFSD